MHSQTVAARESRLRRLARRQGLMMLKSRRAADAGLYALVDISTNCIAFGSGPIGFDAELADIEAYLSDG
jgi:hypothetical protein